MRSTASSSGPGFVQRRSRTTPSGDSATRRCSTRTATRSTSSRRSDDPRRPAGSSPLKPRQRARVLRLVELELAGAGDLKARNQAEALVLHRSGELDAFALQLGLRLL